jgi:hypothetical protein
MSKREDLQGQRFERLVALEYAGGGKWLCECDCGNTTSVFAQNLKKGNTRSCGCLLVEARIKHGMADTLVYHAWRSMFQRCENPKDSAYKNYGARGITVCEDWRDFPRFIADMGMRPHGFQLDRIDNSKGYSKDNCRWVSAKVNRNNQRNNRLITFNGKTQTVAEWADELGIVHRTLHNRLSRGWPVERALTEPVN